MERPLSSYPKNKIHFLTNTHIIFELLSLFRLMILGLGDQFITSNQAFMKAVFQHLVELEQLNPAEEPI